MARILVVDDDRNIRKMVRLTLRKDGHEIAEAEDGPQGLVLFDEGNNWDLLVVDQRMPGMEGTEVITEARRRDPAARVMMTTSFATIELASRVLLAGAGDFLRKPFSAGVLRGAVSAAVARPRQAMLRVSPGPHQHSSGQSPPQVSYYYNGYEYWPADTQAKASAEGPITRRYIVRSPEHTVCKCTVEVTPHVGEQVLRGLPLDPGQQDFIWDSVCRNALANYLWENASMPPELLPVFELTERQLHDVQELSYLETHEAD